MFKTTNFALALLVVGLASSCIAHAAQTRFMVGGFEFVAPSSFEPLPTDSAVRKAQFTFRNEDVGRDGLVIFYHFGPGLGGSVNANITRWYSHFEEPNERLDAKIERLTRAGRKIHVFRAFGTMIQGPRQYPDFALFGAIIESQEGNVFIRFTAPRVVALKASDDFRSLILSPFQADGTN